MKIRPHHLLCIEFFVGKGYSMEFVEHMTKTIEKLNVPNTLVEVVLQSDEICRCCPNHQQGICNTEEKVQKYDQSVLNALSLKEGCYFYKDLKKKIQNAIGTNKKREDVCGDCQWSYLCKY